ncbi:magnesium transporter [Candidatus Micrarchaeota archaeon]|nr:magnesium transporter [Candidatus Micrarchaeota archaeon]
MVENHKKNGQSHLLKIMNARVPTIGTGKTVADVFSVLKKGGKSFEVVDYVYVIGKNGKLVGVFSIKDVFRYPKDTPVEKFMQTKLVAVSPDASSGFTAHLALKHQLSSVPVVKSGTLLGVVSPKEVMHLLNKSLRKDFFHFAGIHRSHLEYENTMTVPLFESLVHRTPWLFIGLLGILLTAAFIGIFEKMLEKHVMLAFFIPTIVYLSDALGTQIQTLFIRDLAVMGKELSLKRYLLRQMLIGFLIALVIAAIMFLVVSIFWSQSHLAFVISLAAFATLVFTSFTALMITTIIERLGYDPALGGGPFATVISDATSIVVYFVVASLLL